MASFKVLPVFSSDFALMAPKTVWNISVIFITVRNLRIQSQCFGLEKTSENTSVQVP